LIKEEKQHALSTVTNYITLQKKLINHLTKEQIYTWVRNKSFIEMVWKHIIFCSEKQILELWGKL